MEYDQLTGTQKKTVCNAARAVVADIRANPRYNVGDRVGWRCANLSIGLTAVVEALARSVLDGSLAESELDRP